MLRGPGRDCPAARACYSECTVSAHPASQPAHASSSQPPDAERLTPAMRQYWAQKQQVPDAILLFRMGDFYELFYDDAKTAAEVLGLTLTSRDGGRTPLAGIPYHALENYLARLVAAGYKVAISEQIEDAAQARGVVQRAIVRIVTPGTLTDDALLDQTRPNTLAALWTHGGEAGIASVDLAGGQIYVQLTDESRVLDELARLDPAEVLLPAGPHVGPHPLEGPIRQQIGCAISYRNASEFNPQRAEALLTEQFQVRGLHGFGFERIDASLQAAGALLAYVRETQRGVVRHLRPPRRFDAGEHLVLDPTTIRSLEIERSSRGGSRRGSLLAAVDGTCSAMGARLLRHWLLYPLRDPQRIELRLSLIEALREAGPARKQLRSALREMGDIELMTARIGVQRTSPRELRLLGEALGHLPAIREALRSLRHDGADLLAEQLEGLDELATLLTTALRPDAPTAMREGGIFAAGYDAELDRLRKIGDDGQQWLAEFQAREVERTGIGSLKVGYNRVFGYYIEVTHAHRDRIPPDYVRKQTLKNAERYITDELKRYEHEVLGARQRACELEYDLFCKLREQVAAQIPRLQQAAAALATADVLAGWAELSLRRRWCRPQFVEEPILEIDAGRHPVLEEVLGRDFVANDTRLCARLPSDEATERRSDEGEKARHEGTEGPDKGAGSRAQGAGRRDEGQGAKDAGATAVSAVDAREDAGALREHGSQSRGTADRSHVPTFPPSHLPTDGQPGAAGPHEDFALGSSNFDLPSLALITGPNMAGKSTYIRQVALITLLAHAGCWVPARRCRLGVVDRIFTRVGAADELARGQSTFMVEMLETANILHNATARSLVILDEIGRGTSTFDGLSLAWAITEYLATRIGCRTLFATHYHEVTELAELLDGVANLNVAVREFEDRIVFLHTIVPGAADRSYGLHVAKLAGIPPQVLERAHAVLCELERTFDRESRRPALAAVQRRRTRQLRLFEEPEERIVRELRELSVESLDPHKAAELLTRWRKWIE